MPSPAEPGSPGRLCVVGDLVEDVVVWASEPVRRASDTAAQVFRTRGGSAANTAAVAAGLAPTRFIGCVGADAAGTALVEELRASGAEVLVQQRGRTGTVVLIVDPDGERHMFPDRAAAAELDAVDPAWLDGVARLHVPSYGLERDPARSAILALAAEAHRRGVRVSVDVSSTGLVAGLGLAEYRALLDAMAPELLFANAEEAALLGIGEGRADAGAPGAPLGVATVVVKHGPRPTRVYAGGELVATVPVAPVARVRDLTGAGDAFAAGFLAAALAGAALEAACLAGHDAAAGVLAAPGAAAG